MKNLISKIYKVIFSPIIRFIDQRVKQLELEQAKHSRISQQILISSYHQERQINSNQRKLHHIGFSQYSENNEDGVLLYIFSQIGTSNKKCVEIGSGYGNECNTANLIINHKWQGLLIDSRKHKTDFARTFFSSIIKKEAELPKIVEAHITRDNVNSVVENAGFIGDIDLLSIDIDGVDYWIWEQITVCRPRVVEVQCIWGKEESLTVPYDDYFKPGFVDGFGIYSGASLAAFTKLAKQKGYRFIGVESSGYNAFFVRHDVSIELFPEIDISVIDELPFVIWARDKFLGKMNKEKWVRV